VTTDGIDTTTPHGKLRFHILGAVTEFERERLRERTLLGLDRARRQGTRLGQLRSLEGDLIDFGDAAHDVDWCARKPIKIVI
jgi:DNA invertase Pin-like site-specific DNA recombinase